MPSTSAKGALLGSTSKPWRIGSELGSGACGSVHSLEKENGKVTSRYVVKVAPYDERPGAAKGKKRKKTAAELNADLLNYENTLYRGALNKLRGRVIPDVPDPGCGGPPGYGHVDGFRFIVMERMEASVPDLVVPAVRKCPAEMGDVAVALVDLIQSVHECHYLVIDVKMDNFMVSFGKDSLASRLRLIDLGLIEFSNDITTGRPREDAFPGASLAGTPLYASINVLKGHTVSRRDDLEAVGYVLAELILLAVGHGKGKLPWSDGRSDIDILRKKEEMVTDSDSVFYEGLSKGGRATEEVMKEYFDTVRGLDYEERPDYDGLKELVGALHLQLDAKQGVKVKDKRARVSPVTSVSSTSSRKKPSPKKTRKENAKYTQKRAKDVVQPTPSNAREARALRRSGRNKKVSQDTEESEVIDVSDDSTEYPHDSRHETIEEDENSPPRAQQKKTKATTTQQQQQPSLKINITVGPHSGESFHLTTASPSTTIGRDPSLAPSKKTKSLKSLYKMSSDMELSAIHASFALHLVDSKRVSGRVTDLNSTNGTFVTGPE
eukprot:CAMPEP_0172496560 /NCGR_PEP_ID=MMETSP1066-20121228/89304_1 /TAXON_ID=671091 /ORGANISM="Coscinodiscus wailesii, Strain CCMP2513" /LENGTH=549 /DNA_ID=CAMNT_0013268911 /DNA_START=37 /DNA_END=1687 /DNA_ORIENTATION=+